MCIPTQAQPRASPAHTVGMLQPTLARAATHDAPGPGSSNRVCVFILRNDCIRLLVSLKSLFRPNTDVLLIVRGIDLWLGCRFIVTDRPLRVD